MLFPIILIGIMIVIVGFMPVLFVDAIKNILPLFSNQSVNLIPTYATLSGISITAVFFVALILILWWLRTLFQKKQIVEQKPTWGCGYTGGNPALFQYTATSYTGNFVELSNFLVNVDKHFDEFKEEEIFPQPRTFKTHSSDIFENYLITKPTDKLLPFLEKIAVFQTGKLQHYLLYALVFMALIIILTIFNFI